MTEDVISVGSFPFFSNRTTWRKECLNICVCYVAGAADMLLCCTRSVPMVGWEKRSYFLGGMSFCYGEESWRKIKILKKEGSVSSDNWLPRMSDGYAEF